MIHIPQRSSIAAFDLALALQRKDARIRIIDLSRNFGHHKAIMSGLGA
jgi:putative glycosyltransferase